MSQVDPDQGGTLRRNGTQVMTRVDEDEEEVNLLNTTFHLSFDKI